MVSKIDHKNVLRVLSKIHHNNDVTRTECVVFGHYLTSIYYNSFNVDKLRKIKHHDMITLDFVDKFLNIFSEIAPNEFVTAKSILSLKLDDIAVENHYH